jgi:hypothetical protein
LLEILIGVAFWLLVFFIWYARNYPDKMPSFLKFRSRPRTATGKNVQGIVKPDKSSKEYRKLVETVENVCALDRFGASDAASMVLAVKKLIQIERASGQIWETYALDALETADVWCDDCRRNVTKTVNKDGIRIDCHHCNKWLELKNSKVAILDVPQKKSEITKNNFLQ